MVMVVVAVVLGDMEEFEVVVEEGKVEIKLNASSFIARTLYK